MKHMIVDLYDAPKHAQICMRDLGITYELAVPQSISDSWWFFNCENVPAVLPPWAKLHEFQEQTLATYFYPFRNKKPAESDDRAGPMAQDGDQPS